MKIFKNAICPACTLLCDDVTFQIDGDHQITTDVACEKSQSWTQRMNRRRDPHPQPVSPENISEIADALTKAKMPLIAGVGNLTMEAQQSALKIADACRAAIDIQIAENNQSSLYALQRQGKVTASLGEIAGRGDMVVFWFCDPATTHPRLIERLSSKKDKHIVVVDSIRTATAKAANEFIQLNEQDAAAFLGHARQVLMLNEDQTANGSTAVDAAASKDSSGMMDAAATLVASMTKSCFGSFFYGHLRDATLDQLTTLSHQKLVRSLNDRTRFVSLGLRDDANSLSGENVLSAFSGYPMAVNYAHGFPQYQGQEYSAARLLERGHCDYLLWCAGSEVETEVNALTPRARSCFDAIPKTVISSAPVAAALSEDGRCNAIRVAAPGVDDGGEFCRLDDVPLPLVALRESKHSSAEALLKKLATIVTNNVQAP